MLQIAKVLSTSTRENRAKKQIPTLVAELRRGQNVTADFVNITGESSTPVLNEWVIVAPRGQSFGRYFAFGFFDVLNQLAGERGVKILFGRTSAGVIKTKLSLTDAEIILENDENARLELKEDKVELNAGAGTAVEQARLQESLNIFAAATKTELEKIATLLEPKSPSSPYIAPTEFPIDISSAKSEKIKLP